LNQFTTHHREPPSGGFFLCEAAASHVRVWQILLQKSAHREIFCHAKLGRYRGMADIEQALTPFNLAEATD
jgi:hypothetical protein